MICNQINLNLNFKNHMNYNIFKYYDIKKELENNFEIKINDYFIHLNYNNSNNNNNNSNKNNNLNKKYINNNYSSEEYMFLFL